MIFAAAMQHEAEDEMVLSDVPMTDIVMGSSRVDQLTFINPSTSCMYATQSSSVSAQEALGVMIEQDFS